MNRVAVIGGGAGGLAAALSAAREGASVFVLEARAKAGRKLLLTGSGRCNLAPGASAEGAYHGDCPEVAERLLKEHNEELFAFFASCGIETRKIRDGYYPRSEDAADVLKLLLAACAREGVKLHTNTPVIRISKEADIFRIHTPSYVYEADKVILACGSAAGMPEEEVPEGYALACSLGHGLHPVRPALVPLVMSGLPFPKLSGCRVRASLRLFIDQKPAGESSGQIQFTDYGLSGIAALDLSGRAGEGILRGEDTRISLDLFPEMEEAELTDLLAQRKNDLGEEGVLTGLLPEKAARYFQTIYKEKGYDGAKTAHLMKQCLLKAEGLRPMRQAQVVAGGIPCGEVREDTFASAVCPGLYICGEMLDVDGICGGFNLAFAFLGGIAAGKGAAHA